MYCDPECQRTAYRCQPSFWLESRHGHHEYNLDINLRRKHDGERPQSNTYRNIHVYRNGHRRCRLPGRRCDSVKHRHPGCRRQEGRYRDCRSANGNINFRDGRERDLLSYGDPKRRHWDCLQRGPEFDHLTAGGRKCFIQPK